MSLSLILVLLAGSHFAQAAENAGATILGDFDKQVSAYVRLRKDIESNLPRLKDTPSPEKISEEQRRLHDALRDARKSIAPGNIFTPPVAAEFRRLIGIALQADGKRIEASLRHAEPVQVRLHVNDGYPANLPIQSTPPSLLANLPRLPRQIEYRVAGRDLILLDVKANLVVDLVEDAVP